MATSSTALLRKPLADGSTSYVSDPSTSENDPNTTQTPSSSMKIRAAKALTQLKADVTSVVNVMSQNLDSLAHRGENLDDLENKVSNMESESQRLFGNVERIHDKQRRSERKWNVILIVVASLLLLAVTIFIIVALFI